MVEFQHVILPFAYHARSCRSGFSSRRHLALCRNVDSAQHLIEWRPPPRRAAARRVEQRAFGPTRNNPGSLNSAGSPSRIAREMNRPAIEVSD
jgi:hypothetical protein